MVRAISAAYGLIWLEAILFDPSFPVECQPWAVRRGVGWLVAAGLSWRPSRQWSTPGWHGDGSRGKPAWQTHTSHCHGKTPSNRELNNSQEKSQKKPIKNQKSPGAQKFAGQGSASTIQLNKTLELRSNWQNVLVGGLANTLKCQNVQNKGTQNGGSCLVLARPTPIQTRWHK